MAAEKGPAAMFVADEGDAGQNGGVFIRPLASPKAATALATDGWADARPLSEQLSSYPSTCLLAALFVTVRKDEGTREHVLYLRLLTFAETGLKPTCQVKTRRGAPCSDRQHFLFCTRRMA